MRLTVVASIAAGLLVGCGDLELPEPSGGATRIAGETVGTTTVEWTIEGVRDPDACTFFGASGIRVVVVDVSGAERATLESGCASFSSSIRLDPGTYSVRATLSDRSGQPRTSDVSSSPFDVNALDGARVSVDFPALSFRDQLPGTPLPRQPSAPSGSGGTGPAETTNQ